MYVAKPNSKPFWKEPSLKHVWARANDGAKIMCYTFLFILVCMFFAYKVNIIAALWMLGYGVGFVCGYVISGLNQPD
jgi:hypothetical protein